MNPKNSSVIRKAVRGYQKTMNLLTFFLLTPRLGLRFICNENKHAKLFAYMYTSQATDRFYYCRLSVDRSAVD